MRISSYNATTNFVDQTTSTLSNSSATNITVENAGNNMWYLTRLSSQTGTGYYYVNYQNGTYSVVTQDTSNAALYVYKQVTIENEEPDEPDKPKEEKWILINSTDDIKAGDTYIVGYYNDTQYTNYNSHYMGVDSSNNIIRGEIAWEEVDNRESIESELDENKDDAKEIAKEDNTEEVNKDEA